MRYRKLSATGDYVFGAGLTDFYINTPEAVGQAVETTLKLFLGEWYLDTTAGTPYFEEILGYHSQAMADQALQNVILNVQGVVDITEFSSSIDPVTRKYSSVVGLLNTIYGPTQLEIKNLENF